MNRLRNRLILVFGFATLAPLLVTAWISISLLELSLAPTNELDQVSRSLEKTGRELYQRARETLKTDAALGRVKPRQFQAGERDRWPAAVEEFFASGDADHFALAGTPGDQLDYLVRQGDQVWVYSTSLHGVGMKQISDQYAHARALVSRDLRRGFTYTFFLLAAAIWMLAFLALIYFAHRISRPIQQLTTGLTEVAAGRLDYRVPLAGGDEIGAAIRTFNRMADELKQSQERLVYVARLESWQALARKMAHEVKNSLTPIRLTVEEMVARQSGTERRFFEQAAQIVVEEVESLERRVRAFSQFSAEPPVRLRELDLNAVVEDRVAFLKTGHPEINYSVRLERTGPHAIADEDLVKGILVNLLENAAQAAGTGGNVLAVTQVLNGKVAVEIHDSGPGLSEQARQTLFQPTISFKKNGMGLGLSIARKSALLSGGDIVAVPGELGGAAFRVVLPNMSNGVQKSSNC
jgi:nitrogen fixation/metabolism regulation signal transduction histidine kinase